MEIGLALPQFDFSVPGERPLPWETVRAWARRAEELGFGSVWLADHLFWDIGRYGGPPGPRFGYDPLVSLAALGRATSRVRLGTLVLNGPIRPPTVLAKALASLDVVSGGRLIVGLGAGNFEPEFRAAGVPFARPGVRLAQLGEILDMLRGMFGGGPFTFEGEHYRAVEARCLPRPIQQPHPPLWVGGRGDRLLDLVARKADGWNTVWRWSPEDYRERIGVLGQACERAGRDPATVTLSLGLYALAGEDSHDLARRYEHLQRLSPDGVLDGVALSEWREVRAQLLVWRELGVSTLILCTGAVPFSVVDDGVEVLARACSL